MIKFRWCISTDLNHTFKLVHAKTQFSHTGFKELSQPVFLH